MIDNAIGDATLRCFMNWEQCSQNATIQNYRVQDILAHYQKLGKFRKAHPAVGAGKHTLLSEKPYVFKREFTQGNYQNKVIVGLDLPHGKKEIAVSDVFKNHTKLTDYYSGKQATVKNGKIAIDSPFDIVLLGL